MERPPNTAIEFAAFVKEHSRIINKVCWAYSDKKVPYEDLRQEILTNLWVSLDQFRGASKLSTWVYRVAVNSALMTLRSYRPRIETVPLDLRVADLSTELDDAQRENLQILQTLINRLEAIEKAIMLMWLDGYPYDEIADTLGMKRNTVAAKIHRIKEKLSKQI